MAFVARQETLTSHGVHGLERNDFGHRDVRLGQKLLQVARIIVTKQVLGNSAVTDALNHRRVVPGVRKYLALFGLHKQHRLMLQGM